jgi:hypothetical protein
MSDAEIDALLLQTASLQWSKVAFVVAKVAHALNARSDQEYEAIGGRVRALVYDGHLIAQGDLTDLRHSEVRLVEESKHD